MKAHARPLACCQHKHVLCRHYLDEWMEEGMNVTKERSHSLHLRDSVELTTLSSGLTLVSHLRSPERSLPQPKQM